MPGDRALCLRSLMGHARNNTIALNYSMAALVVDDASTVAHIIRNMVKELGIVDVDDANSGAIALAKMYNKPYGLVISDWNMKPMTGFDLLRTMRAAPDLSEIPFIMVTAQSQTKKVIAAKNAGANNFIAKPFNLRGILAKIEAVLTANAKPITRLAC